MYGIAFLIFLLVNDVICSELMADDEFVVMDGIRVKKDSIRNETSDGNRKSGKRDKKAEQTESDDEDQDEEDEDDDDDQDDDEEEIDISEEEDLESTKHLPTKCHGEKMPLKCFFYVSLINKFNSSFSSTYVRQEFPSTLITALGEIKKKTVTYSNTLHNSISYINVVNGIPDHIKIII